MSPGRITPHLNIYSKKPKTARVRFTKSLRKKNTISGHLAPGKKRHNHRENTGESKDCYTKAQELFNDASREVNDAMT